MWIITVHGSGLWSQSEGCGMRDHVEPCDRACDRDSLSQALQWSVPMRTPKAITDGRKSQPVVLPVLLTLITRTHNRNESSRMRRAVQVWFRKSLCGYETATLLTIWRRHRLTFDTSFKSVRTLIPWPYRLSRLGASTKSRLHCWILTSRGRFELL